MIVDILWAITMAVFPIKYSSNYFYTYDSTLESNALVASSNKNTLEFLRTALEMAILYF